MNVQQTSSNGTAFVRELSPESRKYIGPPPPRGTKRRPPKTTNMSGNPDGAVLPLVVEEFNVATCVAHIISLNPKDNEEPLNELTAKWLSTPNAPLPASANSRIYTWMHQNAAYNAGSNDFKTIDLVNRLRKGTNIEELEARQYLDMEARVLDRFRLLSRDLLKHYFIEIVDGRHEKTKLFVEFWKNKGTYWEDNPSSDTTKPKSRAGDIYDMDDIYDNDTPSVMPPPKRPLYSKFPNAQSLFKSTEPASITPQGNPHSSTSEYQNLHPAKRLKNSNNNPSCDAMLASSTVKISQSPSVPAYTHEAGKDDEDIRNAMEFLSSPTPEARQSTPPRRKPPNQPITPTSPAPTPRPISHDDRLSAPPNLIVKLPIQSPNASTLLQSPAFLPSPSLEISINFQSIAGNYNLRKSVPASRLRLSSLPVFFELASERMGIPAESLDYLTFRYNFAGSYVEVISKNANDDEWEELKHNMRRLYRYGRERFPRKRDFDVWVDPGNTRDIVEKEEEEDLGGL